MLSAGYLDTVLLRLTYVWAPAEKGTSAVLGGDVLLQVQRESMHIITVSSNLFNNTVNPDLSQ